MTIFKRLAAINLAAWVIIGAVLGIGCGVFFGQLATTLEPIGSVYVMLLQMAVFPFIISSLLHGLGSLSPGTAIKLLKAGAPLFLVAWFAVFVSLWLLVQAMPEARPPVVISPDVTSQVSKLVSLLVPANPFADLTRNYVPAIVIFCLFYGVAIQGIQNKAGLLDALDVIRRASATIWQWVVRIAPFGVFAMFADLAGSVQVQLLGSILIYLLMFVGGSLIVAFWLIPALVTALAPVDYRDLLDELRDAIVIAVVTSLPISAVPMIIRTAEKLVERCRIEDASRQDIIRTTMAVSYPFAQLGNLFVVLFIAFAAYYFHAVIGGTDWLVLPLITILSTVGTPVSTTDAVGFLASWLGISSNAQGLYVGLMTLTRYPQVLVSTMGLAFITLLVPLSYYGLVKIKPRQLLVAVAVGAALLVGLVAVGRAAQSLLIEKRPNPYLHFSLDPALHAAVRTTLHRPGDSADFTARADLHLEPGKATMSRIRERGTLRVGYGADTIPFSYFNVGNDLVGYDVAYMYALARDLNVDLELWPITDWEKLDADLVSDRFDIAIGGIYVTDERLRSVTVSDANRTSPLALLVRSGSADRFLSRAAVARLPNVKIAVLRSDVLIPLAKKIFPAASIEVVTGYDALLRDESIDAGLWTLDQAKAWAEANPGFTAVVTADLGAPLSMAYLMPPNSPLLIRYIDEWMALQRANGFDQRTSDYWLNGAPRESAEPRWSVIHNLLHWLPSTAD
jgi:Na+/H+-dicarboxylate symporter/ABC-type amino acid transport substrate-binding protein